MQTTEPETLPRSAGGTAIEKSPDRIAGMFDAIAVRYDLLNHVLSGGADWYWRWRAIRALHLKPASTVLDLCTGTCDFGLEALRRARVKRVVGIDFAAAMLRIGQDKLRRRGLWARAPLVRGDAARIPLAAATVDAVTMAFGIRNVEVPEMACREMARVLRPGGQLAVLEFSMPTAPGIRQLYAWYFRNVLPRIGRLVSRHSDAYSYLPTSVGAFFTPAEFTGLLTRAGFEDVRTVPLTFGVVQLYLARRP
jgi:demethylmenaquinone methyltransferase/2-methoxy-6-polyprenyl-1,4-benzoquinol methylase